MNRPAVTVESAPPNNHINRRKQKHTRPEPPQIIHILPGHLDVHAPHAADDVHGQDDGAEDGQLAEHVGGLLLALVHEDVDLGEVVGVGAGEEAAVSSQYVSQHTWVDDYARLVMRQVAGHRHDVVLDVAQVQADLRLGRDLPLLVAALGEALDDVGLVAEQAVHAHDLLAALADAAQHVARGQRDVP